MEKCISWVLVYPFLGGFLIKSARRMCICEYVKNRIGTYKKCVFGFEEGYKQIIALDSCKTICFVIAKKCGGKEVAKISVSEN